MKPANEEASGRSEVGKVALIAVAVVCGSLVMWKPRSALVVETPPAATSLGERSSKCRSSGAVVSASPGFPSYCDFEGSVTYDGRSLLVDGSRALFASGSVHGPRGTKETWGPALDLAVENGLNMVEVYVFWNVHAPYANQSSLIFEGSGDLAMLVKMAGRRGLFVTLRIGPYVCAEWDYGGLPVWVGLEPGMVFRSYNEPWMRAMASFCEAIAAYATRNGLWAGQGGPVVLAQIENELEGDPQYVQWCGDLAHRLETSVVWLMCNGDSANNTVNTCNGESCVSFLEENGQNGRVLVDQPALWTENEGGFQVWGDTPSHPDNYFWGRTARNLAYETLRWIARGGTHVNYYMWWGGSNFGHFAGASISTAYAYDVVLCPNGAKHQPKYDHLSAMHAVLKDKADDILSRMAEARVVDAATTVFAFSTACVMVENAGDHPVTAEVASGCSVTAAAYSVSIVDPSSCSTLFDSSAVSLSAQSYERIDTVVVDGLSWTRHEETPQTGWVDGIVEQSRLTLEDPWTQYSWYETTTPRGGSTLVVESDMANAWLLFVDGRYVGESYDVSHDDGPLNYTFADLRAEVGSTIQLLSESLGFGNTIGRWGASSTAKFKGIAGNVFLDGVPLPAANWRSKPGLEGPGAPTSDDAAPASWSAANFGLDAVDPLGLFLDAASLGRGHFYVNGYDAGRFWNISSSSASSGGGLGGASSAGPTQRYYHIPPDWLYTDRPNTLLLFDALGGDPAAVRLLTSRLSPTTQPNMPDQVDSPKSCLI